MNKLTVIQNTEFTTIEHAAYLLECSTNDIEHFLLTKAIGGYFYTLGHEAQSDILLDKNTKERIEFSGNPNELIQEIVNTELSRINGVEIVDSRDVTRITIEAQIQGLWSLDSMTTMSLLCGVEVSDPYLKPVHRDSLPVIPLTDALPYIYGFDAPGGLTKSDIKILGHDLFRLYESLHDDAGPLPNIHNSKDVRQNVEDANNNPKRGPYITVTQSDLIVALTCLVPGLREQLKVHTKASDIIDARLEASGHPRLCLGDNNYYNAVKRAKYCPEPE